MNERPDIHHYLNYRSFLQDMYAFHKQRNSGFSHRQFSRIAGLRSSNFLKLVMDGKRNLSTEATYKFAKAMKLNREETLFFESLVRFNQAKSAEEKNLYYERISRTKSYNDVRAIEVHQYAYFSNWHFVAIRELVGLAGFKEDPKWINRRKPSKKSPPLPKSARSP